MPVSPYCCWGEGQGGMGGGRETGCSTTLDPGQTDTTLDFVHTEQRGAHHVGGVGTTPLFSRTEQKRRVLFRVRARPAQVFFAVRSKT